MPELPEVEAVRRGIDTHLIGKRIRGYELTLPKLVEAPSGLTLDEIVGQAITTVERRGKYLALIFPSVAAVLHLKLAGQVVLEDEGVRLFAAGHPVPAFDAELPHKSTHLIIEFEAGCKLYVTDIRHFTRIRLMPVEDLGEYWVGIKLGPDALSPDFTLGCFRSRLARRRKARLKPLLLDQGFVAGLGNIYVDESLHRAGIHPERLAPTLTNEEIGRLYQSIHEILEIAVPIGGAEILNGKAGPEHGEFPYIHGREGEPCLRCQSPIVKTRVNGRGTYLCVRCQPEE